MFDPDFDKQKLMYHPEAVATWLASGQSRGPLYTELELTRRCNCRCIFCGVDHQVNMNEDRLDPDLARKIIDGLAELGNKAVMMCGNGEPLLHPQAGEIIAYAAERMSVSVTTNGAALSAGRLPLLDHLEWIRFSVNGGSPENYAWLHGTNVEAFELVMANIAGAVARKRALRLAVTIGAQIVLLPENAEFVLELARRFKAMGVDYFSVKPYSQHPLSRNRQVVDYRSYLALAEELRPLADDNFKVVFRGAAMAQAGMAKSYRKCFGTHFIAFISANGDLWECNVFVGDPRFFVGNIRSDAMVELWRSDRRKAVLAFIADDLKLRECRDLCRMESCNRYLWRLKNPLAHDNFI